METMHKEEAMKTGSHVDNGIAKDKSTADEWDPWDPPCPPYVPSTIKTVLYRERWRRQREIEAARVRRGAMRTQWQQLEEEEEVSSVVKRKKVAADVTIDLDILDCPICFLPLRPPIFQCTVGHVICSSCHDKPPDKCHFCCLATVYNRCYMIEHVVESIKVACSNANHGCTARITYYEKEDHEKGCPHAPCFCPETGCGFSGPTVVLLDHFSGKHKWHSRNVTYKTACSICIKLGSTVLVGSDGNLFLVNMILEPLGGIISVCSVQPHITGSKFKCRLTLFFDDMSYSQTAKFQPRSTNLYDGLPKDCFPFLVPKALLGGSGASATATVYMTLMPK